MYISGAVSHHENELHSNKSKHTHSAPERSIHIGICPMSPNPFSSPFALISQVIQINLNSIVPSVSGPKRPQDRVAVTDMKNDFRACLNEKVSYLLVGTLLHWVGKNQKVARLWCLNFFIVENIILVQEWNSVMNCVLRFNSYRLASFTSYFTHARAQDHFEQIFRAIFNKRESLPCLLRLTSSRNGQRSAGSGGTLYSRNGPSVGWHPSACPRVRFSWITAAERHEPSACLTHSQNFEC